MKIYSIAFFLLIVNLSISLLCSMNILPVEISTISISDDDIKSEISENLTYSDSNIGLYIYGDFLRSINMLKNIFIIAPNSISLLMGEAGVPNLITSLFSKLTWAVYLVGLAQIIMKWEV